MKNIKSILAVAAVGMAIATSGVAADQEYLPKLNDKAQDAFRAGLAAALKPLPKCQQQRLLESGGCCPMGYVSLGKMCARIAPPTCASVAIDNPKACALTQCARYIREVPAPKTDKKGKPLCKIDDKGKPIPKKDEEGNVVEGQCEIEMGTKEVPCEPWRSGVRDMTCLLDTYECSKAELATGPTRWCGDWMKKITVPPPVDDEGKPVDGGKAYDKFIRCKPSEKCDPLIGGCCEQVVRECTGKELTSNSSAGFGPCQIGEYVSRQNKCTAYSCPKHCTTPDGRCAACGPDYKGATEYFEKAYAADDHFFEAYFNHAMALEKLGRYKDAIAVYQKADKVQIRGEQERKLQASAQAFIARAKVSEAHRLLEAGEQKKANGLMEQARSKCEAIRGQHPDNVVANNVLSLYWLGKGNLELAEKFIRQVLRVDRENTIALNVRGLINLRTKKDEIVRWILEEKVLAIDPANPEAFANLGLAYVRLGDLPRAVIAFERAVKLKPNSVAARLNLGAIYMEYLNYKAAERQYGAALKLEPNNLEGMTGYALASEGRRNAKKAAELYERVLSKDATRHALLVRLALIYEKAPFNDNIKAIEYWKRYKTAAELPHGEAVKAERNAARLELAKLKKKRVRRKARAAHKETVAKLAVKEAALTKKYKNVLAIDSRIMAIEQGMQLEKEARDAEAKKPSS
jgi:tetratricopeptide (TPR) repeat protein